MSVRGEAILVASIGLLVAVPVPVVNTLSNGTRFVRVSLAAESIWFDGIGYARVLAIDLAGDFNSDGIVNAADSSHVQVPEPAAALLLVYGLVPSLHRCAARSA